LVADWLPWEQSRFVLLDGSEAEAEQRIADAKTGDYVFPLVRCFIVILHKE